MVLESRRPIGLNTMVGRRIPHPASTKFHDDVSPPAKRLKTFDSTDGDESRVGSDDGDEIPRSPKNFRNEIPDSSHANESDDDETSIPRGPTELESALPPVKTDKEAIDEYEAMRSTEAVPEDLKSRLAQSNWVKGKSSIYVDAFNLALDTVLGDEAHLFDRKEMEVFYQWKELEYEAQYLYVFLVMARIGLTIEDMSAYF